MPEMNPEHRPLGDAETGEPDRFAPLTRRRLLTRSLSGAALLSAGAVLEACGSSSKQSTHASAGGTTAATAGTSAPSSAAATPELDKIRSYLNIPTGKPAGQGLSIMIGGDYSLTGAIANDGVPMYQGAMLGLQHITALGGPNFKFVARNTPLDNFTAAGAANTREFGTLGIPAVLTSQGGGGGAGAPFYPQFKMWAIDCGGVSKSNESKPFFYQGRAEFNSGMLPTIIAFTKAKRPEVKRVSYITYALGGAAQKQGDDETVGALKAAGFAVASPVLIPAGATDFTTSLAELKSQSPDLIISFIYTAGGAGVFLKQYMTSGIGVKVVNLDYTPEMAQLAGPEAIKAFEFCFDYFDAKNPGNGWAKIFVSEFQRVHGKLPIYYSANYYEAAFWVWDLIRRIIAKGGDPTKQGNAYVDAMNENPSFPSLYGGGTGAHGTDTFNLSTHTIEHRTIAYGQANADGTGTIYATGDITGSGFKLTAAGSALSSSNKSTA